MADHGDLRVQHVPGGEQAGVQGDGLEVAAERLAHGDRAAQPVGRAQSGHGAGEPQRQGAAVGHHVRDPGAGAVVQDRGADGGQGGVQVGGDDGHRGEVVGGAQELVVGGVLFVDAEDDGLQRGVTGLDHVAGGVAGRGRGGGRGQPVRDRDDQGVSARAQAQGLRVGVDQDAVADLRGSDQIGVG